MSNERRVVDFPPTDFEKKTISNTAAGLTAAKYAGAMAVFITVETAAIRYRIDGTDPDATTGHLVQNGGSIYITDKTRAAIENLSMIRDGASDATIQITYY